MQLTPENTRAGYEALFSRMQIRPDRLAGIESAAKIVARGQSRYDAVEKATSCPWWVIGLLHMRESSCNFSTFLGNGEPLNRVTRLVPKGRGPWPSWEAGAIEALAIDGLDKVKTWDIPTALFYCEKFNGFGYISHNINSPYVWSGSNLYSSGKFAETPAGSTFVPSLRDPQPGVAPMLKILLSLGLIPSLAKDVITMVTKAAAPSATPAAAPSTSAGVTISPAQNLATHIITGVGAILAGLGLTQAHSIYDAVTNPNLFGGVIVSALAMAISHFTTTGSNSNTIDLVNKVLVALAPPPASPLAATASAPEPAAPSPSIPTTPAA